MKILLFVIQFILLCSLLAFAKNTRSAQKWKITQHNSVLNIRSNNGAGTGFLIEDNHRKLVVTNAHIISVLINKHDKLPPNIQLIGLDLLHDLAVLKIKGRFEEGEALTLVDTTIETNSKVTAIGFPEGKLSRMEGQLLPYNYTPNERYMMIDYSHLNGASGSPVLNSKNQVIGIITLGINNLVVFSSVSALKNLLSQLPVKCEWKQCLNNELKRLHQLAETDPHAQYTLGRLYFDGQHVPQNLQQAQKLWWAAAEQGLAPAQYDLFIKIWREKKNPIGQLKHMLLFTHLIKQASDQEYAPAQYVFNKLYRLQSNMILRFILFISTMYSRNLRKADEGILAAAKQEFVPAMLELSEMYKNGVGVPQNLQQAIEWLLKATQKRNDSAILQLAEIYSSITVPKDLKQAKELLIRRIVETGNTTDRNKLREILGMTQKRNEKVPMNKKVPKETIDSKNPCADSFLGGKK